MKVELSPEAQAQALVRQRWWVENRPAAPDAFADELEAALRELGERPLTAAVVVERGGVPIRRWLLPKTRCHLYYVVDDARDVVRVLAAWGARMGQLPPLAKGKR